MRGYRHSIAAAMLLATVTCVAAAADRPQTQPASLGLTVDDNGVLLKDGRPYRGIGINYFGAFYDTVRPGGKPDYIEGFRILAEQKAPFVRFAASPFWPKHWDLYLTDKAEYFRRFDAVVAEAAKRNVGLIPSIFWHQSSVSDIVGEPRDQWGHPTSKTHEFMRTYTREVVTRYRNSPAIWAWEFGNEFNLAADLPNAAKNRPKIHPKLGTPTTRSARDDIAGTVVAGAHREFAKIVRQLDPHRAILSGASRPRPSAWHNAHRGTWDVDTRDQFTLMLFRDNPDPMDMLSIHVYPRPKKTVFPDKADMDELIRVAMQASRRFKKPLFIGEFGANSQQWPTDHRKRIEGLFASIERHHVPLAAVWVFGYPPQDETHNIRVDNERAYIFELIREANRKMQASVGGAAGL